MLKESRSRFGSAPRRAAEFVRKLEELLDEGFHPDQGEEGVEFAFSYTFFPVAGALEDSE